MNIFEKICAHQEEIKKVIRLGSLKKCTAKCIAKMNYHSDCNNDSQQASIAAKSAIL